MTEQKWSPEPWKYGDRHNDPYMDLRDADNMPIQINAQHWNRIIACVNACAGIPTEELETTIERGINDRHWDYHDPHNSEPIWLEQLYGANK